MQRIIMICCQYKKQWEFAHFYSIKIELHSFKKTMLNSKKHLCVV